MSYNFTNVMMGLTNIHHLTYYSATAVSLLKLFIFVHIGAQIDHDFDPDDLSISLLRFGLVLIAYPLVYYLVKIEIEREKEALPLAV